MTTIVWDGKCLSGDTKRSRDHEICVEAVKVFKIKDPDLTLIPNHHMIKEVMDSTILVGSAGQSAACISFIECLQRKQSTKISDKALFNFASLIITDRGEVFEIEDSLLAVNISASKQYSIGSGSGYALAALACGKNGVEAIEIASRFDHHTSANSVSVFF